MAWIQLPSVSVANGSKLVTVPGGYDLANVESGWSLDVGTARAEIQSVSAQDASGVSTITLARNWDGSNVNAQPAQIVPIAGGELYVIKQLQDANDYAVQTHAALRDYGTQDADITLTPPGGEPVSFASLPKQDRLASEQRNSNQQSFNSQLQQQQSDVNDLLSNKTADGNDTTPGALLQVGATVKQLDTTNSNIRFEPSTPQILSCDFVNQRYRAYDGLSKGVVDKTFAEVVDFTRASGRTGVDALDNVPTAGIDEPVFEYRDGKPLGLSIYGSEKNYIRWPTELANWSGSTPIVNSNSAIAPDNSQTMDALIEGTKDGLQRKGITVNSAPNLPFRYVINYELLESAPAHGINIGVIGSGGYATINFSFDSMSKSSQSTSGGGSVNSFEHIVSGPNSGKIVFSGGGFAANQAFVGLLDENGLNSFTGDGVRGVHLWGMQLTFTDYHVPFIYGSGTEGVTAPDNASIDLEAFGFESSGNWTLLGEFLPVSTVANSVATTRWLSINDSTNENRLEFYETLNGEVSLEIRIEAASMYPSTGVVAVSEPLKFGFVKEGASLKVWLGSDKVFHGAIASTDWNLTTFLAGRGYGGSTITATQLRNLELFAAALPSSEVEGFIK